MNNQDTEKELVKIALAAGSMVSEEYARGTTKADKKKDGTFVSKVDKKAEAFIKDGICAFDPAASFFAEETYKEGAKVSGDEYVIDAIDGSAAFLQSTALFGISIGKLSNFAPVAAVFYMPQTRPEGDLYSAAKGGDAHAPSPTLHPAGPAGRGAGAAGIAAQCAQLGSP